MRASCFALFCGLLLTVSCGRKSAPATAAMPRVKIGYEQRGVASWYGRPYHGRATASGEIYDMEKMTAAHQRLPFGVTTRVENLTNGKSVDVRINDRGPFKKGRIIDLSHAAARRIDLVGPGVAKVRIQVIAAPPNVRAETDHPPERRFAFLLRPFSFGRKSGDRGEVLSFRSFAVTGNGTNDATNAIPARVN
jgi:rare lipoprotein A (peptidoglycan hydrolase)